MKIWNLVAAVLVVLLGAITTAPAVAHSRVLMLHPKWRQIEFSQDVQTSGPWVLLGEVTLRTAGTLINERTGTQRSVPLPAGCADPPVLGAGTLVFDCGEDVAVVSLTTGAANQVAINPQLASWEADCQSNLKYDDEYSCGLGASGVGSDWIEFDEACGEHCLGAPPTKPDTYFFQNLRTGELSSDPTGGSTYADLSTSGLARRFCSPLRIPTVPDAFIDASGAEEPGLGSVGLDGSFAVVAGGRFGDTYDLEKCGSGLRELLPAAQYPPPAYNSNVVLWEIRDELQSRCRLGGEFDGLFLPSRRRFILCVPGALFGNDGYPNSIVLSRRTLFVGDQDGLLWEAPSPVEPR